MKGCKNYTKKLFKKKRWKDFEKPATMKVALMAAKMINMWKTSTFEKRFQNGS